MNKRWVAGAVAALAWLIVLALALHRSGSPTVLGRYSPEWTALLGLAVLFAAAALARALVPPREPRLPRRPLRTLLGLGLAALLALATAELAFRQLDLFGTSLFPEIWRYALDTTPDPDLFYRHQPGLVETYQGVPVRINELGLRERPLAAKAGDALRLVVLGDSVTFGWGVREEETFTRRLESELGARIGRSVETVNTGVCGYNTTQEQRFLELHGNLLAPDLVVLVYVDNDVTPAREIPHDLGTLRAVWNRPDDAVPYLLCKSLALCLLREITRGVLAPTDAKQPERNEGWRESMASLAAISQWSRERSVPFVVFLYRMTRSPSTDALLEDISAVGSRAHFSVVDVQPWFEGRPLRPLLNSFLDVHPSGRAHELLAARMADALVVLGSVTPRNEAR